MYVQPRGKDCRGCLIATFELLVAKETWRPQFYLELYMVEEILMAFFFALFLWWWIGIARRDYKKRKAVREARYICKSCGTLQGIQSSIPGHLLIEIILWCCGLVPGLIYTVWRRSSKYAKCSVCSSKEIVPLNSPMGRKLESEISLPINIKQNG